MADVEDRSQLEVQAAQRRLAQDADAQGPGILDAGGHEGAVVRRRDVGVARLGPGHDLEHQRAVGHRARHRPVRREAFPGVVGRGRAAHEPARRLVPDEPQQAAGMRIEPPPSEPCASVPMPAASAAPAPPLEPPGVRVVVGIARGAEEGVLRRGPRAHLGRVGLADQHGPGAAQARDAGGVREGHVVGERRASRTSSRRAWRRSDPWP